MSEYEQAIKNLQRAALAVIEALPPERRDDQNWSTPLIVAAIPGESQVQHFIATVERSPVDK